MNSTEKMIFNNVDQFFEEVTAISSKLVVQWEKPKKAAQIKIHLKKIALNDYLYMPTDPQYKLMDIDYNSGSPM